MSYRLIGKDFNGRITEFNLALGVVAKDFVQTNLYKDSRINFDKDFHPIGLWRTMSNDNLTYDPSNRRVLIFCSLSGNTFGIFSLLVSEVGSLVPTHVPRLSSFSFGPCFIESRLIYIGHWLASQISTVMSKK